MYWIYMNLGCRFEFKTQKLPYEKISGHFDDFIDLGHTVRVCKLRACFKICCFSKCIRFCLNLGCRFELRTQKLPYEKISGHVDDFIDLDHTVCVCKIRSFFKISCISKCLGFT